MTLASFNKYGMFLLRMRLWVSYLANYKTLIAASASTQITYRCRINRYINPFQETSKFIASYSL